MESGFFKADFLLRRKIEGMLLEGHKPMVGRRVLRLGWEFSLFIEKQALRSAGVANG